MNETKNSMDTNKKNFKKGQRVKVEFIAPHVTRRRLNDITTPLTPSELVRGTGTIKAVRCAAPADEITVALEDGRTVATFDWNVAPL